MKRKLVDYAVVLLFLCVYLSVANHRTVVHVVLTARDLPAGTVISASDLSTITTDCVSLHSLERSRLHLGNVGHDPWRVFRPTAVRFATDPSDVIGQTALFHIHAHDTIGILSDVDEKGSPPKEQPFPSYWLASFALSGVHPQDGPFVDIHGEPWCVATPSHVSDVCKKVEALDVPAIPVFTDVEVHARCTALGKCDNHWFCEDHRRMLEQDEQQRYWCRKVQP